MDATERKTLMGAMFAAGCLLLAPRQWASAAVLLGPSIAWFVVSTLRRRRASISAAQTKN
jgi:hypothetical protein